MFNIDLKYKRLSFIRLSINMSNKYKIKYTLSTLETLFLFSFASHFESLA